MRFGEGKSFLGSTTVNTDGSGNANFSATFLVGVQASDSITGTATDANNNTSEFSQCQLVNFSGATPTPTPIATPTPTITPPPTATPTPTPTLLVLRSTNIALSAKMKAGNVMVTGVVTVRDGNGALVSNATVFANWTLPNGSTQSQTATTNSNGNATFTTKSAHGTYTLTETNISKAGYTFDSANSVMTGSITK